MINHAQERWDAVPFDEIVSRSAFGPRFSGDLYSDSGNVATLRTTDLSQDGEISYSSMPLARIDEEKFAKHFLAQGDLVISRSGRVGTTAVFERFIMPVLPGAFLIKFCLTEKANPYYYKYFFNSPEGQKLIQSVATGAAQQNINITNVKRLMVPLPSTNEQDAIVGFLSTYDDLIKNNTQRIALLEEMAQRLCEEWFVKFRFPGHEEVSFDGELPSGWNIQNLEAVATVNPESIKPRSAPEIIHYIDIASVSPGHIESIKTMDFSEAPGRARRKVRSGDVIWSCVRPNRRSHALVIAPDQDTIASTGFAVLRASRIPYSYLYQAVTTDSFVSYLVNHATGAAYPAVKQSDFEAAKIMVPSQHLLEKFNDSVEPMLRLAHSLEKKNANIRAQRDLLLPKLVSGQIDVSEIVLPDTEGQAA